MGGLRLKLVHALNSFHLGNDEDVLKRTLSIQDLCNKPIHVNVGFTYSARLSPKVTDQIC